MLFTLILCALLATQSVYSADIPKAATYVKATRTGYHYLLVPPLERDSTRAPNDSLVPLIVSLHGKSLSGSNIRDVTKYGTMYAINDGLKLPAYVIAPQCPMGQGWNPDRIMSIVDDVCANYPIDTNRIYVLGMSMGGYGTFDFVGTYPDKVAAAIAICGGGKQQMASNLCKVPLWVIHGTSDVDVPISQSRVMVSAIKSKSSKNLHFTELPRIGHSPLAQSYNHPKLYDWLLQHDKSDRKVGEACMVPPPEYKSSEFTWLSKGYSKKKSKRSKYAKRNRKGKKGKAYKRRRR